MVDRHSLGIVHLLLDADFYHREKEIFQQGKNELLQAENRNMTNLTLLKKKIGRCHNKVVNQRNIECKQFDI